MTEEKKQELTTEKKLVVISGITSGIGEGLLHEFRKKGYNVSGFGRNKDKIEKLRKEFNLTDGDSILFENIDITNHELLSQWGAKIISKYGAPSIIINNVGSTIGSNNNVWNLEIKEINESLQTNIIGDIIMCKIFIPSMIEKGDGIIINISSWQGKNGVAELSPYCINKFAIEGLTQCLAKEFSDSFINLAAVSVSPGWVNTGMTKGSFELKYCEDNGIHVEDGKEWATKSIDWLLSLNGSHNGKSLGPPVEKESMKKYCDFLEANGLPSNYDNLIHPSE